jgi:hypothetical protein
MASYRIAGLLSVDWRYRPDVAGKLAPLAKPSKVNEIGVTAMLRQFDRAPKTMEAIEAVRGTSVFIRHGKGDSHADQFPERNP